MLDIITRGTQYYGDNKRELTNITVGGRDEKSIDQYSAGGVIADRRHNAGRRVAA
jgi:hypothetical protein